MKPAGAARLAGKLRRTRNGDPGLGVHDPGHGPHRLEDAVGVREVLVEGMQLLASGELLAHDADVTGGRRVVLDDAANDSREVGELFLRQAQVFSDFFYFR